MTNILSMAQMTKQMSERAVKEAIGTAFDELVTKPLQEAAKLPEHIFKNMFLPYFNGQRNINDGSEIMAKWYMIAGSAFQEVSIIDERGGELFRVPPIQRTSVYDPLANANKDGSKKEMSIGDISTFAEQLGSTVPIRGANFRDRALDSKIEQLSTVELALKEDASRWQAIFDRYAPAAQATQVKTTGLSNLKPPSAGDQSYDELEF